MRLLTATILACALPVGSTYAQDTRVDAARIDSIFAFANNRTPGCAVSTMRNGVIDYAGGYGMADLEHDVPITPRTPFYMASVSKQFTAAAINLLAAEGKLSLDDDVRKHVQELPRFDAPITIRHLVNHTSGLRDYLSLFNLAGTPDFPINNNDFLEMLARQRALNFTPGAQYSYSNSGYVLMSILVERVTGKSLRAFMEERFFEPLGMTSTVFRDRNSMLIKGRALAYFQNDGKWMHAVPSFDVVGDGGLFSTVTDLARWEAHMLEPRIGGAQWRTLTDTRGRLSDGTALTYGAGVVHGTYRGETTVEHGGGYGGYSTYLLRFPAKRLSVAVLCNGGVGAGPLAQRVANLYLGPEPAAVAQASPTPVALSSQELRSYAGTFFSEASLLLRDIAVDDGKLFYVRGPDNRSELAPLGGSRFQMVGQPLVLTFAGRDTLKIEARPGDPETRFRRVTPGKRDLREYAGTYVSSDLPTRMTVQVADTGLMLKRARGGSWRVDRAFDDAFRGPVFARFRRDSRGKVEAMEISLGERARHVRFDRQP